MTPWTVARLLCPCYSLGKNTGVGCHSLLQGFIPTQELNSDSLPSEPPGKSAVVALEFKNTQEEGFRGGSMIKTPPTNAGDMGLISDPGRSHMLRSN